jgi:hypothetical protein
MNLGISFQSAILALRPAPISISTSYEQVLWVFPSGGRHPAIFRSKEARNYIFRRSVKLLRFETNARKFNETRSVSRIVLWSVAWTFAALIVGKCLLFCQDLPAGWIGNQLPT